MKKAKKKSVRFFAAGLLATVLLLCFFAAPIFSAQGSDTLPLAWAADSALTWLAENIEPPQDGDEAAVIALVQSGRTPPKSSWAQSYENMVLASPPEGGKPQAARRLLALATAQGQPAQNAESLIQLVGDENTAADIESTCLALLVFGFAGYTAPEGGLYPPTLAARLALVQYHDGGFGLNGVSDAKITAQVLASLAFYKDNPDVEACINRGLAWLQTNAADYGGFELDGTPSAEATAEVIIALACLGQAGLYLDDADNGGLLSALAVFQNEDGSFSKSPDEAADVQLTSLCALALVANARQQAGLPCVYTPQNISPVPLPLEPPQREAPTEDEHSPEAESTPEPATPAPAQNTSWIFTQLARLPQISVPALPWLTTNILLCIAGAALVLIILIAVILGRRKARKRKAGKKQKNKKQQNKVVYRKQDNEPPKEKHKEKGKKSKDKKHDKQVKPKW